MYSVNKQVFRSTCAPGAMGEPERDTGDGTPASRLSDAPQGPCPPLSSPPAWGLDLVSHSK